MAGKQKTMDMKRYLMHVLNNAEVSAFSRLLADVLRSWLSFKAIGVVGK